MRKRGSPSRHAPSGPLGELLHSHVINDAQVWLEVAGSDTLIARERPVLQEVGDEQEWAARSLGASASQTFWRITLPSIKWAVVYGVVLSLARSLGEYGAVKVVSGNIVGSTQTATLVVEEKYLNFDRAGAYATAFLLALVSVACIVIVSIVRPKEGSR